jgi:hypothetical protein
LKMYPRHNKRMHATADTKAVMLRHRLGAARDARRYALSASGHV